MKKTAIKTLTALALMSASHLALATRELLVTDIEFVHPSKTQEVGYISKITFLPQSDDYDGKNLGKDILQRQGDQLEATTTLNNGVEQQWGLGLWMLPEGHSSLSYDIHMPTKKQPITIVDDDGALTRGALEALKDDQSLQAQSALTCANPLIKYTGYETQKNHGGMSWQNNFKNTHLMYYGKPEQKDGAWEAVRINPAKHKYKVAPNVVHNILTTQTDIYEAIQDEVESLSEMTTTSGTLLTKQVGAEEFSTTFAQKLNNAAQDVFAKNATLKLHIAIGFSDNTDAKMVWERVDGEDSMTKKRAIEAIFESVHAGERNNRDSPEYYGLKLQLKKTGEDQAFVKSGPVYYENQEFGEDCCVADSWSLHASKSAKQMLYDKLEKALQEKSAETLTYLSNKQSTLVCCVLEGAATIFKH